MVKCLIRFVSRSSVRLAEHDGAWCSSLAIDDKSAQRGGNAYLEQLKACTYETTAVDVCCPGACVMYCVFGMDPIGPMYQ